MAPAIACATRSVPRMSSVECGPNDESVQVTIIGLSLLSCECARPSRSATPGLKFIIAASAVGTSSRRARWPASDLRSRVMLRLLRLIAWKYSDVPPMKCGGISRVLSPVGGSILMTSAPRSASICVLNGPARAWVKSRMRTPASSAGNSAGELVMASAAPLVANACDTKPLRRRRRSSMLDSET